MSDVNDYIDGTLFALGPDDESGIQNGYHLCVTLPPGSSDRTVCQLQTVTRTGDSYDPYVPDGEVITIRGDDEMAMVPIVDTFTQCLKSTVLVNGREVEEHVYSLCDSLEPHVHQLVLSQYTVRGADTVAA